MYYTQLCCAAAPWADPGLCPWSWLS